MSSVRSLSVKNIIENHGEVSTDSKDPLSFLHKQRQSIHKPTPLPPLNPFITNRLISPHLAATPLATLTLTSRYLHTSPTLPPATYYRILGAIHPVYKPKGYGGQSSVELKMEEWQTVATARHVTGSLLTRVIIDGMTVPEGETRPRDTEMHRGSIDEGALLLATNLAATPAAAAAGKVTKVEPSRAAAKTLLHGPGYDKRLVPECCLVYRTNSWYPSTVVDYVEATGIVTLRIRGHSPQFDMILPLTDPRVRPQLNTQKDPGNTHIGHFAKGGEAVKIFTVDVVEAEYFLKTGQLPVGRVKSAVPAEDCAVVEVVGLTVTEVARVSNIHMAYISEEEFGARANRILEAREEAVRQIDGVLCERCPTTVVWRSVVKVDDPTGGARCLVSSVDVLQGLQMKIIDPKTKKRMSCVVSWAEISKLLGMVLPEEVYWGDLEREEKRGISSRLSPFCFVKDGELLVIPFHEKARHANAREAAKEEAPSATSGALIATRSAAIQGVNINVEFRDTGEKIILAVEVVSGKKEGKVLFTHVVVLRAADWAFLSYSNCQWMSGAEKIQLCDKLMGTLIAVEGVVCVQGKTQITFPERHEFFEEAYGEGWVLRNCEKVRARAKRARAEAMWRHKSETGISNVTTRTARAKRAYRTDERTPVLALY